MGERGSINFLLNPFLFSPFYIEDFSEIVRELFSYFLGVYFLAKNFFNGCHFAVFDAAGGEEGERL